nr:glycosyltransferase [uncultured Celeribacter sp.]
MIELSIVTISFNQDEFLGECLDSVVSQMCEGVEYIVVDPGSEDGSRQRIESYGSKIRPVFEPDSGPADGLNNGFREARGEYLFFLNADDILLPGAVDAMLEAIRSDKRSDVFCFGGYLVDRDLNRLRAMRTFRFSAQRFCRGNTSIYQQGLLFSAEKFQEISGFNKHNRTCWDAELAVRMSLAGATFEDRPNRISYFRIYETSITGSGSNYVENRENKDRLYEQTFGQRPGRVARLVFNVVKFEKYFYWDYLSETVLVYATNFMRGHRTKKASS